jgi:adenosine kinase
MSGNKKNILVAGSIAYDHLMSFDGLFKDSFLKENIENLSLSLFADTHEFFFGGCAPNIAYALKLLGHSPIILGVAGKDFADYKEWLEKNDISTENIFIDQNSLTASANILTDKKQNQLTIFSPAAMKNHPIKIELKDDHDIDLAILSPENPLRMVYFGDYFVELGIPYIFDPGQAIPVLSSDDLKILAKNAFGLILNQYEWELFIKKTGVSQKDLMETLDFIVVTAGENGCRLIDKTGEYHVDALKNVDVVDSTGCGDAFRAGFIDSYVKGKDLIFCCRSGNEFAVKILQVKGTQNYSL